VRRGSFVGEKNWAYGKDFPDSIFRTTMEAGKSILSLQMRIQKQVI
jgi:hypothetical protein